MVMVFENCMNCRNIAFGGIGAKFRCTRRVDKKLHEKCRFFKPGGNGLGLEEFWRKTMYGAGNPDGIC
jgi:hypothetical protein